MRLSPIISSAAALLFTASSSAVVLPDGLDKRSEGFIELEFDIVTNLTDTVAENLGLRKRGNPWFRGLYNQYGYYITYLYLGSNQQKVGVDIDTGSSDLWVVDAHSGCVDNSCQYGDYDPSKSSSAKKVNEDFSIRYGDKTSALGPYYKDSVALGTCKNCAKLKDVQFASATENTAGFGVFGIGLKSGETAQNKYPNFMDVMKDQKVIAKKGFSLYLNKADASTGSIIFGGKDTAKIDGKLVSLPLVADSRLSVKMDSVSINGKKITANSEALIDSGTSFCGFNPKVGDAIFKNFKNGHYEPKVGYYVVDCDADKNQKVTINFKGISIDMSFADAFSNNLKDKSGKQYCGFQIGQSDFTILGDIFMRNAYTVFNYDDKTISFGHVKFTDDKNLVAL